MRPIPNECVVLPVGVAERVVGDFREKFDPWDVPAHILLTSHIPTDLEARLQEIEPFGFSLTVAKVKGDLLILEPDALGSFYDLIAALNGSTDPELIVAVRDRQESLDTMRMMIKSTLPIEAYASEVNVIRDTSIVRTITL